MIDNIIEKIKKYIKEKIDFNFGKLEPVEYRHLNKEMIEEGSVEVKSEDKELIDEIFLYNNRIIIVSNIKNNISSMGKLQFKVNVEISIGLMVIMALAGLYSTLPVWLMMLGINMIIHFIRKYVEKQFTNDIGYPSFAYINAWIVFESGQKKYVSGVEMR